MLASDLLPLALAADDAAKVEEGKPAPNVKLEASLPGGKTKTVALKDLQGKNVVLYFYPKALTGG